MSCTLGRTIHSLTDVLSCSTAPIGDLSAITRFRDFFPQFQTLPELVCRPSLVPMAVNRPPVSILTNLRPPILTHDQGIHFRGAIFFNPQ